MDSSWVEEELKTVQLHDRRLSRRLAKVLSQLSERPATSLPAACGGYSELAAAYRFFGNEKATFAAILQAHVDATRRRINAQPLVVLVQDTTELELTRPRRQVTGAGPLDGAGRFGALLHVQHAFTADGTPLGTASAEAWTRASDARAASSLTRAERAATPIEAKESERWLRGLEAAQRLAENCPATRCLTVADSEADIFELLAAAAARPALGWIVRACQNRALSGDDAGVLLRQRALAAEKLLEQTVLVRSRQAKIACEDRVRRRSRATREALVAVRAATVVLRPPWRAKRKLSEVEVNVVLAQEENPPPGEAPVEWLLLTNLAINNAQAAEQVIKHYCVRWMIEVFFRTLKSGCRIEERRFEQLDRTLACAAVYLIVAWRTLYVCRLGRSQPDVGCDAVFDPAEWKAAWNVVRRQPPPVDPPSLHNMVRLVAQLGGYINKPRGDPPGPQTVWIGLQRVHDFALCWKQFGPGASEPP
jgi:Transposase DNA-binding/Transposase Tn5 dimerisation domain